MNKKLREIEALWRAALKKYGQQGLKRRLQKEWPEDRNVEERISCDYPPTFQPGYVGSEFLLAKHKVLLLGQNPGEGSNPVYQSWNVGYHTSLRLFAKGELSLASLSSRIGAEMKRWSIFAGKGIFTESGDSRASLIPAKVRPSIKSVAYLNAFPFKTVENARPLRTPFYTAVWLSFVMETIRLLEPTLIVRFPDSDTHARELEGLGKVIRVWHPSDYNFNTRRQQLVESWSRLPAHLQRVPTKKPTPSSKKEKLANDEKKSVRRATPEGRCRVVAVPETVRYSRLDVYCGDTLIGEYERSIESEIERKKGEILGAFQLLLDVYKKHGQWVVRWDGTRRVKSIRVKGTEVGVVPKEYWGRPGWTRS